MKLCKKLLPKINYENDKIDKEIINLYQSTLKNYMLSPIINIVDMYFISKLTNEYAMSGQGSADKLFNSLYSILSFIPNIITIKPKK